MMNLTASSSLRSHAHSIIQHTLLAYITCGLHQISTSTSKSGGVFHCDSPNPAGATRGQKNYFAVENVVVLLFLRGGDIFFSGCA
jgi:hypothetical protein